MTQNRSPEFILVYNFASYEWQTDEQIIEALRKKVQPGRATRRYQERYNESAAKRNGLAPPKGMLPVEDQISSGARSLLRDAIRSVKNSGYLIENKIDGISYYRKNSFTAEEIDLILATSISAASSTQVAQLKEPDPVPVLPEENQTFTTFFDFKHVKDDIVVKSSDNNVSVCFPLEDGNMCTLLLSPQAADWLSDQIGFQAIISRNGRLNSKKALIPTQSIS